MIGAYRYRLHGEPTGTTARCARRRQMDQRRQVPFPPCPVDARPALGPAAFFVRRAAGVDGVAAAAPDPIGACPGLGYRTWIAGWALLFGKDHAPTISWSEMTTRRKVIPH